MGFNSGFKGLIM